MVNQRSKSGCWTCRLRRKKCPEDGMPCTNCKARGVVCHGYGPRPAWKDRGEREQEEVDRLQLRRRSQTRWHAQHPELSSHGGPDERHSSHAQESDGVCLSPSLAFASPAEMALQLSPPQSTEEQDGEPYDFSTLLDLQPGLTALNTPGFWADGMEQLLDATPGLFEHSETTFNGQVESAQGDAGAGRTSNHAAVMQTFASSSIHITTLQEREIELMMQFFGEDFGKLHPCYRASSMTDKAWLMWLLHRSPTFFYAALSTSAYFNFLKTPPHDGKRTEHFREYDQLRNRAIELYCELLEANCGDGHPSSADWTAKETVICSVQLAMLESLSESFDATLTYLTSASAALAKFSDDRGYYISELSQTKSANGPILSMQRKADDFFTCTLIWTHVLHCSSRQSMPATAGVYRRILSSATLGETFFQVIGVEAWALVALMDAVDTAIWKRDQDAMNRLSMRELVSKSEAILSAIEHHIQGATDAQTLIHARGVAIYIHTLTSGCRPAVPEIQDAIAKSAPLWRKVSVRRGELRAMAWAFCVAASLATGEHRGAFVHVLAEAAAAEEEAAPPGSTTVACLRALSEECWKILDAGGAECNWRVVMQSLKRSIRTIFI